MCDLETWENGTHLKLTISNKPKCGLRLALSGDNSHCPSKPTVSLIMTVQEIQKCMKTNASSRSCCYEVRPVLDPYRPSDSISTAASLMMSRSSFC
jgi:hypothetical protein